MLAPVVLLLLACSLGSPQGREQKREKPAPTAEKVAETTAALDAALDAGDAPRLVAALDSAQTVPDAEVVKRVVRALEDERMEVRLAAIQSLRWLEHPDALTALHRALKDRKLKKIPQVVAALLRGVGQHADPGSVEVLARDPFLPLDNECTRAHVLGLGRIRTREAVEALFGILAQASSDRQGERLVKPWMTEMRMSLVLLTGVDHGMSAELWEGWWRESKRDFQVPRVAPELPKDMRIYWDIYWGLPQARARDPRREDRGGTDGPEGKGTRSSDRGVAASGRRATAR